MDYSKLFSADISTGRIRQWRDAGKKAVGIVCGHVPPEIFHALDVLPVRLRATGCEDHSDAEAWMSSLGCSFAKSILQFLMDGVYELDGVVASDGCMLAVRIYDNWKYICDQQGKPQLVYEIGAPRKVSPTTKAFYREELQDLVSKLEELSGNKLTDEKLAKSIEAYNEARALLRRVQAMQMQDPPLLSGEEMLALHLSATDTPIEEYTEMLRAFLADADAKKRPEGYRARLLLIGSALDSPGYIRVIEGKGGHVVADTLCLGSMLLGDEMPLAKDDVLQGVADYYLDRLVCPRMIDNRDRLHAHILAKAKDYAVDGVVYEKMQNCECWGGENVFLEEELKAAGLPLLNLEREQVLVNAGQLEVRAEAFIEMIEKEA